QGRTLGILGFGAIGRTLAMLGVGLGMRVLVSRRSEAPMDADGVTQVGLKDVLRLSDHLVLAAASTADTHHIINARTLRHANPGLHLVNVARGALVDQAALMDALNRGVIAAASLDVTDPEPLPNGHPLYSHPKVRLSPHLSAQDPGLRARQARAIVENLQRYLARQPLLNTVDRVRRY